MRKWMTWMITWILFAAVLSACGKEADDKKLIPKPEKADAETGHLLVLSIAIL